MKRIVPCALLALCCGIAAVPSCAGWKSPDEKKETEKKAGPHSPGPRLIGRIASVPSGQKFVLIQLYQPGNQPEPGTVLTSRGSEQMSANLRVSGESIGHFIAADIQSGSATTGDAVYTFIVTEKTENQQVGEKNLPQETAVEADENEKL